MAEIYEIHIDESGNFERFKDKAFPNHESQESIRLIGGIIVPPELKERENSLREDLIKLGKVFYTDIKRVTDIHVSDKKKLRPGKKQHEAREALVNFFRKQMPEAQITFIYDLEELHKVKLSHIRKETQLPGAQRFRSMLLKLLKALVFYHPKFQNDDSFEVKVAHRRVPYPRSYDLFLPDQGYIKIKDIEGRTEYTAITEVDLISIMDQLKESLGFASRRKATYKMKPFHKWDSPFMVMADLVCNTIFNILRKGASPAGLSGELMSSFMPRKKLIFKDKSEIEEENRRWEELSKKRLLFYCPFDYDFPENILDTYHSDNPEGFLSQTLKKGIHSKSDSLILLPAINLAFKNLKGVGGPNECRNILLLAHEILDARLYYLFDDVVENLIGLAAGHLGSIENGTNDEVWAPVLYLYHDVALRYSNHTSNVARSIIHRDKGQKIFDTFQRKDIQDIRGHHEFINRASVEDANEFAFERANTRLESVKEKEEELTSILKAPRNKTLGKIYGSLAQNYAFLSDHNHAKEYFMKAADHLGLKNRMQTSFRAHLAIDMRDKKAYQSEMCSLFKEESFPGYASLAEKCLESLTEYYFDLHLVLKGLIVWPGEEETTAIAKDVADRIHPERSKLKNHSWELIFIVMARLLIQTGDSKRACDFWEASAHFHRNEEQLTFVMFGHAARAWEALYWMNSGNIDKTRSLLSPIAKTFQELKDKDHAIGIFNPNKKADELDGKVRDGWFDEIGHRFLVELDGANEAILKSLAEEFINRFTFNYW